MAYSNLSYAVINMIIQSGFFSLISFANSIPFIPGISISKSAIFISVFSTIPAACFPLLAMKISSSFKKNFLIVFSSTLSSRFSSSAISKFTFSPS